MQKSKGGRNTPPKTFTSVREAKSALANLADSLSTHQFKWPAAAIQSYLSGKTKSLDDAFGLPAQTEKKPAAKKKKSAAAAPSARRRS